jgi:hypothetical protein
MAMQADTKTSRYFDENEVGAAPTLDALEKKFHKGPGAVASVKAAGLAPRDDSDAFCCPRRRHDGWHEKSGPAHEIPVVHFTGKTPPSPLIPARKSRFGQRAGPEDEGVFDRDRRDETVPVLGRR